MTRIRTLVSASALAIGVGLSINSAPAVAGDVCEVNGTDLALGTATGIYALACGNGAEANGVYSIAIGFDA